MYDVFRIVVFMRNTSDQDASAVFTETTEKNAVSTYHSKCYLYSKDSSVKHSTVMLFDQDGGLLRKESFIVQE